MDAACKKRVLVLDGSALERLGIVSTIRAHPLLEVCADTGDFSHARELCREHSPDVLVLDLQMQLGSGPDMLLDFRRISPKTRPVVLTHEEDEELLGRAISSGARAFLSKADDPAELLGAIVLALGGEPYTSRRISGLFFKLIAARERPTQGVSALSAREFEIFRCLGRGASVKEIARACAISARTVETHQARIKQKLGVHSCAELQHRACQWQASRGAK